MCPGGWMPQPHLTAFHVPDRCVPAAHPSLQRVRGSCSGAERRCARRHPVHARHVVHNEGPQSHVGRIRHALGGTHCMRIADGARCWHAHYTASDGMHATWPRLLSEPYTVHCIHLSLCFTQPSPHAARRMLPGAQAGRLAVLPYRDSKSCRPHARPSLYRVCCTSEGGLQPCPAYWAAGAMLLGCPAPCPSLIHPSSTTCVAAHLLPSARAINVSMPLPAALRPRIGACPAASATATLPAAYWDGCLPALLAQHTRLLSACSPPCAAFTPTLFVQIASSKWAPKSSVIR